MQKTACGRLIWLCIEVKRNGRDSQMFYDDRLNARAQRRILLEAHLREAISDQAMQLYYQPIVCIQTSQIKGAEALLRWTDPLLGEVSPAEFIPLTEELNLIEVLGDWVIAAGRRRSGRTNPAHR